MQPFGFTNLLHLILLFALLFFRKKNWSLTRSAQATVGSSRSSTKVTLASRVTSTNLVLMMTSVGRLLKLMNAWTLSRPTVALRDFVSLVGRSGVSSINARLKFLSTLLRNCWKSFRFTLMMCNLILALSLVMMKI
jgi:hypothetical protein